MNLASDRFYKGAFNFRRCANGAIETVARYSYETANDLYDVIPFAADGVTAYRMNGYDVQPGAIHRAIREHFAI